MQTSEPDTAALDLAAIAGRVRRLMATAGLDGTDFASRVGVPYGTMRAYVTGGRPPSPEFLVGCFRAFGFQPAWVLTGDGPMAADGSKFSGAAANEAGQLVAISRLQVGSTKAPHGTRTEEAPAAYLAAAQCVTRSWLEHRGLSAEYLRAHRVTGTSMQGVLFDGDMVLVNLLDSNPRSGFLYVIRQGAELLVKYCETLPGNKLRVSSANPAFAPYDVDLAQTSDDFVIIGRVVASMHDW